MDAIYLTNEGFLEFQNEFSFLKEEFVRLQTIANSSYVDAVGDGWHDNFSYEDAMRQVNKIANQLDELSKLSHNMHIVSCDNICDDVVNINDVLELCFYYDDGTVEYDNIKLTGLWKPHDRDDYQEITLNSPLGNAIYKKGIGDRVSYVVNDKELLVEIIRKL